MKNVALALAGAAALAGCTGGPRLDERRAFLGASAEPSAVIAAELAFAREARERGTWTAFRRTATPDALWPAPGWQNVQTALKGMADPAQPIMREPDQLWVSCDGSFALSTGPATDPSGKRARFATIWQRQDDGRYRWVLDQGLNLETDYARPEMIGAKVASCGERRRAQPYRARRGEGWQSGQSDDGTLAWTSTLAGDCGRTFSVRARQGGAMSEVFRGAAAPPAPQAGGTAAECSS